MPSSAPNIPRNPSPYTPIPNAKNSLSSKVLNLPLVDNYSLRETKSNDSDDEKLMNGIWSDSGGSDKEQEQKLQPGLSPQNTRIKSPYQPAFTSNLAPLPQVDQDEEIKNDSIDDNDNKIMIHIDKRLIKKDSYIYNDQTPYRTSETLTPSRLFNKIQSKSDIEHFDRTSDTFTNLRRMHTGNMMAIDEHEEEFESDYKSNGRISQSKTKTVQSSFPDTHIDNKLQDKKLLQHCTKDECVIYTDFMKLLTSDSIDNYSVYLSQFIHFISVHNTDEEFESIYNQLSLCHVEQCDSFKRN
eukprot:532853_1